jgi:hypothetical protein
MLIPPWFGSLVKTGSYTISSLFSSQTDLIVFFKY